MNWLEQLLKTAGAAPPASLMGGGATALSPPLNPVQQIAAQRGAVQSDAAGDQTALMEAQQAAATAQQEAQAQKTQVEQQAAQQVTQLQQQLAEQQMKAQQEMAAAANKAHADQEQMKAQVNTEKAKAELAKVEAAKSTALAEINAKGKEVDTNRQVAEQQLAAQQAQVDTAPQMAQLGARVEALGQPEPKTKPKSTKQAFQWPWSAPEAPKPPAGSVVPSSREMMHGTVRVPPVAPPAPPQDGAGWGQAMQYAGNPGRSIYTPASYRPSFGTLGDQVVSAVLPSVYGQPEWSRFFANAPDPQGFDPTRLAQGVGQDIARSFF
jgi:hypothetical protein